MADAKSDLNGRDLFADLLRRSEPEDLLDWHHRYAGGDSPELAIVEAEMRRRRPGFSLPLIDKLSIAAEAGDEDAHRLIYGSRSRDAGNDAGVRNGASADDAVSDSAGGAVEPAIDAADDVGYPGGKGGAGTYQKLIRLMPPHQSYFAPFLGKDAVLRHKRPAAASFGFDLDPVIIGWWKRRQTMAKHRVSDLTLYCGDGLELLPNQVGLWCEPGTTLIYFDPPYLGCRSRYTYSFNTEAQHRRLLRVAMHMAGAGAMVMISGYPSVLYSATLRDWHCTEFMNQTRRGPRKECVWHNYPPPAELHDPRFAGSNRRERLRIKRKVDRQMAKLRKLPPLERQALLAAIAAEFRPGADAAYGVTGSNP